MPASELPVLLAQCVFTKSLKNRENRCKVPSPKVQQREAHVGIELAVFLFRANALTS